MLYLDFNASLHTQQYLRELEDARTELDQHAQLPHEYTVELRRHVLAQSIHYSPALKGIA